MDAKSKALAIRKRLRDDYPFYTKKCLKVRTKDGDIKPLNLNFAQEELAQVAKHQEETTGKVRIIVLKARQLGLSTGIGAYIYQKVSQRRAQKALVVTHHSDSTKALFDMTKRFHDNVPAVVKPSTKYSSRKELVFNLLDSSYMVATAGGESIARGETLTYVHISELAFWNPNTAKENLNGILQAVPGRPGTAVFIESTANGVSGPFYDIWQKAVAGENGFYPLFIPWFVDPTYVEDVPDGFERTPEEDKLVERYDLSDGQLMFRRIKIATNGIDLFRQEYPSEPDEAFLTTGRPVFNPEQCVELLREAPDILNRYAIVQKKADQLDWEENIRGDLIEYRQHDPGETYYIGADVAMGVKGGDYSVAQVLDSKKRQVAVYRAHVHPDFFANVLFALGERFNFAKIAVEVNNHGLLTATRLWKDMAYPNFYTEVIEGKQDDIDTVNLGFKTTGKTKPMIIDDLRASMRENEIEVVDKTTLQEMITYIVTESGKMEAEQGCFDDCVMALAIANYVHEGVFVPVINQKEWYVESYG